MADCPFCGYAGPNDVLEETGDSYVIQPLNPVTKGHLLVIPPAHDPGPDEIGYAFADAYALARRGGPFNLILSFGREATQTVEHPHIHVVPRRVGDGLALPWGGGPVARCRACDAEMKARVDELEAEAKRIKNPTPLTDQEGTG